MRNGRSDNVGRTARSGLLARIVVAVAAALATSPAASAATTATLSAGALSVFGDSSGNTIVINRDNMEFHSRASLEAIVEAAGLPMFREIPYTEIAS